MTRMDLLSACRPSLLAVALAACASAPATRPPMIAPFQVTMTGHGPAVILIPGLSSPGAVWDQTVAHLAAHHTCYVFTLAGFAGQPAMPGEAFLTVEHDAILAYIRAHGLARPLVVGHSLGGFLAYGLAASAPDEIGGVLAIDGVPFLPALQDPATTPAAVEPFAAQLRTKLGGLDHASFARQTDAALAGMITKPADVARVAAAADLSDPRIVAQAVYEVMTTDLRARLGAIRGPVWLIEAGDLPGMHEAYAAQIAGAPDHRVIVAATSRHFVMLDDPALVDATLDEMLAKVQP